MWFPAGTTVGYSWGNLMCTGDKLFLQHANWPLRVAQLLNFLKCMFTVQEGSSELYIPVLHE